MAAKNTHTELLDVTVEYGAALRHREQLTLERAKLHDRLAAIDAELNEASDRITSAHQRLASFFVSIQL